MPRGFFTGNPSPLGQFAVIVSGAYAEAVVALNPSHYYPLEETGGSVVEEVIQGVDGTYFAGNNTLAESALVNGQLANPQGDGVGNNVELDSANNPVNLTQPFTIAEWVRIESPGAASYHTLFSYRNPTINYGVYIFWTNDASPDPPYVVGTLGNGTTTTSVNNYGGGTSPAEQVLFVVLTYDSTNLRLYVNGALVGGPTAMSGTPAAGTGPVSVVANVSGNYGHLAIWKGIALGATTISDLYDLGLTPLVPGVNKVKLAGTFQTKPVLIKVGGTFVEKTKKLKVGGTFV